jgi:hypothetical protein
MPEEKTQIERLEDIFNKLDDFGWLIKCISTSHVDEFYQDQFNAAMNCVLLVISDIKQDVAKLIENISSE